MNQDVKNKLFAEAVRSWNATFGGVSASDLATKLDVSHPEVMKLIELWVQAGRGTMNANVELSLIGLPTLGSDFQFSFTSITTHIFFPSKEELTENFYGSGMARLNPPEYKKRLMCGEHQLALCFFFEEVLARYFNHLDWHDVDDSAAGGHIRTKSTAPLDRYVDVRFGKCKSIDGRTLIIAIYKDLSSLSDSEQRHWHANEIPTPELDTNNENFRLFTARTYQGAWVKFPKPIQSIQDSLIMLNQIFSPHEIFGRFENEHLRMPVENTNKALADSCSELYKIIGPDSLKVDSLKIFLKSTFKKSDSDFLHPSGRPLSAIQLLECIEKELDITTLISSSIKSVAKYRIEADHKVITTNSDNASYSDEFISICDQFTASANIFSDAIKLKTLRPTNADANL